MTLQEMRQKAFNSKIRDPFNEAWRILKIVMTDNSDSAWLQYAEELDKFHDLISKAQTPKELEFYRRFYKLLDQAGEVIGEIYSAEKSSDSTGNKA